MTLQAFFDNEAINYLPLVKNAIRNADEFNSNQMRCFAIQFINSLLIPLNEQDELEIEQTQENLLQLFKDKNWM